MGLFDKFKNILKPKTEEEKVEIKSYDKGLEKTTKEINERINTL